MSLKLFDTYGSRANPASIDYPQGSFKNRSAPGVKDGTPVDARWANDISGFLQSLLSNAGISASGQPDKVGDSQYYNAISYLFVRSGTLGTAAYLNSTTSSTDGTSDRLLRVNDFGVGKIGVTLGTCNLNSEQSFNGFQFEPASATPGSPADGDGGSFVANICANGGEYAMQIGSSTSREQLRFRHKINTSWGTWNTIWHDGNLSPASIFGLNQTQKDVTSSKLPGVVYTNTLTRPIVLQISGQSSSAGTQIELLIGGSWVWLAIQGTVTGQVSTTLIPAGVSYRMPVTPVRVMEFS